VSDLSTADSATAGSRRKTAPFVALAIAVVLAALFVVLAGAKNDDRETARTPLMNEPAPDSIGALADGTTFDLARRKGSWVVLNFFDPTCVPCVNEHPELVQFDESQAALGDDGAELYTVVYAGENDEVLDFFDDNGGGWPVVFDDDGSISAAFGVNQVPETWIIDPDGVIQWRGIGEMTAATLNEAVADMRGTGR
jgi:cytochrome c biogenesis protein CcmG/thiol:disulfide interchange protein DsbE